MSICNRISWENKEGDFSIIGNDKKHELREVIYQNTLLKGFKISSLSFREYNKSNDYAENETTYLFIKLKSLEWYQKGKDNTDICFFLDLLEKNNVAFSSHWVGKILICRIAIQHKAHLIEIMKLLIIFDHSISEIKDEILFSIEPYIKDKYRSIHWNIEGDFKGNNIANIPNSIIYRCGKNNSVLLYIKLIHLFKNDKSLTYLYFDICQKHFDETCKILQPSICIELSSTLLSLVCCEIKNTKQLSEIIQKLYAQCPHLIEIHDHIVNTYDPKFIKSQKIAFAMGLDKKLGKFSSINLNYKSNKIYDKNTVKLIFQYIDCENNTYPTKASITEKNLITKFK